MAEEDSAQEKTEEPTQKKLDKAREDGQVPRSKELTTSAVVLLGSGGLIFFGGAIANVLLGIASSSFTVSREEMFDTRALFEYLTNSLNAAFMVLMPLFVVLAAAAVAGPVALGGWNFSVKSLQPKFDKIDPIAGTKRMFSMRSLVELVKSIGKVLVVGGVAFFLLQHYWDELLMLSSLPPIEAMYRSIELSLYAALILSASTIFIVLIDVPYQLHDHKQKMRMSKQEVKDESKDSEGKPEVKGKIRQMQMQMAQNRMMDAVPDADVVITNPTHFSVALKYDPDNMRAPILLAKGVDHLALRIREVAKQGGVEFVESPPLARAIYHSTEVDHEVPEGLYVAVARVLAYVFQLREFRKGQGERPDYPNNPEIPPNYRH
jgi:flagellar biosynthetic protein FlhB